MTWAFAPGRVNLIGDHTDYTGGLVLPMAIQLGTTVRVEVGGTEVVLRSHTEAEPAVVALDVDRPGGVRPAWARYVAGVVAELRPRAGARGTVTTTLPIGAGLASSAALEVAVALALGEGGFSRRGADVLALARLCQRAEQQAAGVPCGIMDQLAAAAGVAGHALLIDCRDTEWSPIPLPEGVEVVAVHCGEPRRLAGSAYAERRAQCEQAAARIGPLRDASPAAVAGLDDPVLRRRARHVVTENRRVAEAAAALAAGDPAAAGRLMNESHASLAADFQVSTPALDRLVGRLQATPGVFGARLTGAGFGGCAVALTRPGTLREGWRLEASAGAHVGSG